MPGISPLKTSESLNKQERFYTSCDRRLDKNSTFSRKLIHAQLPQLPKLWGYLRVILSCRSPNRSVASPIGPCSIGCPQSGISFQVLLEGRTRAHFRRGLLSNRSSKKSQIAPRYGVARSAKVSDCVCLHLFCS